MYKVKFSVLESICIAARQSYPNEFIALLGGNVFEGIIEELVVLPSNTGEDFATLRFDLLPLDRSVFGSVHSHPGYGNRPSRGDIGTFSKIGKIHAIVCIPFNIENIKFYDCDGKEEKFEIMA